MIPDRGIMASRAGSLQTKRRMLYAVAGIAIVAVVVVAGVAYYLDIHRYPSEETSLVLQPWGISWVREQGDADYSHAAPPFGGLQLWWTEFPLTVSYGTAPLNTTTVQSSTADFELPSNLTVLFETYRVAWHSDDTVDGVRVHGPYGVFVTDENANGLFDYGDVISLFHGIYENGTLVRQGFEGNTEYGVALVLSGVGVGMEGPLQFKYAIHHGKLYAWEYSWGAH